MNQRNHLSTNSGTLQDELFGELPPAENRQFYPGLNGLRGVAVLMVFWQHYFLHARSLQWGGAGVDLFFVLSGFLITGILYDTRMAAHRFRVFYARRSLRIFPLYYGVLLLALLSTLYFHWQWHPVWLLWPFYLGNYGRFLWLADFKTHPILLDHLLSTRSYHPPLALYFGHFWSLCVEEQFYLVWPLVVFRIQDRVRLRNICAASLVVCLLARVACRILLPRDLLDAEILTHLPLLRADALLLGGFLALALRGPEAARVKASAKPVLLGVATAFFLMQAFYVITTHRPYNVATDAPWFGTVGLTCIDLFAAGILLRAIEPSSFVFLVFRNRWLRRLGEISYGFYVFHDIPHVLYQKLVDHYVAVGGGSNSLLVGVVALVGTVVLSYLSFRYFETPFLRLKSRFTASPAHGRLALTGTAQRLS